MKRRRPIWSAEIEPDEWAAQIVAAAGTRGGWTESVEAIMHQSVEAIMHLRFILKKYYKYIFYAVDGVVNRQTPVRDVGIFVFVKIKWARLRPGYSGDRRIFTKWLCADGAG